MDDRRAVRDGAGPAIERGPGFVRVRTMSSGRRVLQARSSTTQAGFTAEYIPQGPLKNRPILISDGPQHDEQRRKLGRFFAPAVVERRYTEPIDEAAARYVAGAVAAGECLVDELALHFAVDVTRDIVGLTASDVPGLSRRLEAFFNQPPFDLTKPDLGRTRRQWAQAAARGLGPIIAFHLRDVRPAIRQRRRGRRDDVISHLLDEGYSATEILVECLTYGTAGMVTTREFMAMALWHLLGDRSLATRFRGADRPGRIRILEEIIRLDPVVGNLYRRATASVQLDDDEQAGAGDLIDVCVREANHDAEAVGPEPHRLDPDRCPVKGVRPVGLSFGDGAHACPGQSLALLEADALLIRLLEVGARIVDEPTLTWDDLVAGYRLRGFRIAFS